MKKFILAIAFIFNLVMPYASFAQNQVSFHLTEHGIYVDEQGNDFMVTPFEGQSAQQIYKQLCVNVSSLYNDPSKVINTVEDASVKIRAFSDDLVRISVLGLKQSLGGYYQLEFRIKDGRVRVSAPIVEETLWMELPTERTFKKEIKKYFKDGVVKEKKQADLIIVEAKMNTIINSILGTIKTEDSDNW